MERARIIRNMMTTRHPSLADAIAAERAKTLRISDVFDVPDWVPLEAFFDSGTGQLTDARAPASYTDSFCADTVPMAL